jgi:hypothetical protein
LVKEEVEEVVAVSPAVVIGLCVVSGMLIIPLQAGLGLGPHRTSR